MTFNEYYSKCRWVVDGDGLAESVSTLNTADYRIQHGGNIVLPIITACDRPRSYLKHTVLGMMLAGFGPPIITYDSLKKGPCEAFKSAMRISGEMHKDGYVKGIMTVVCQDDVWVSGNVADVASTFYTDTEYILSGYRMSPDDDLSEIAKTAQSGIIGSPDIERYFYSDGIPGAAYEKYNGGCCYFIPGDLVRQTSLNKHPSFDSIVSGDKLPVKLGLFAEQAGLNSYQLLHNRAFHMGEISSMSGRPAEHRMPVHDWVKRLVEDLDKELGTTLEIPCTTTH